MMINEGLPNLILFESIHISEDDDCMFRTSNSNVKALLIVIEAYFVMIVSSNTAEDYNIYFLALESVNCAYSNICLLS